MIRLTQVEEEEETIKEEEEVVMEEVVKEEVEEVAEAPMAPSTPTEIRGKIRVVIKVSKHRSYGPMLL